jgi:hypothetical protein
MITTRRTDIAFASSLFAIPFAAVMMWSAPQDPAPRAASVAVAAAPVSIDSAARAASPAPAEVVLPRVEITGTRRAASQVAVASGAGARGPVVMAPRRAD